MNDLELSEAVRRADPFAGLTERQAARLGASALAGAERRTARVWPRRFAVAVALVLSSAALAAIARRVTADPPAAHEPGLPLPSRGEGRGEGTERSSSHAAVDQLPALSPHPVPLPARGEGTRNLTQQRNTLGEEAELLLTALRQLRVENDPGTALNTLDLYDRRFPDGALREDADAARREAQTP